MEVKPDRERLLVVEKASLEVAWWSGRREESAVCSRSWSRRCFFEVGQCLPGVTPTRGGQSYKASNLSMSACEYAAPTTRLDSRVVFLVPLVGVALRQNWAVELHVISTSGVVSPSDGLLKDLLGPVYEEPKERTQLARQSSSRCAVQFIPTWTISCYSVSVKSNNRDTSEV